MTTLAFTDWIISAELAIVYFTSNAPSQTQGNIVYATLRGKLAPFYSVLILYSTNFKTSNVSLVLLGV